LDSIIFRDWPHPKTYSYGFEGGNKYLAEKVLKEGIHQNEMQRLKKSILCNYEGIECSLFPSPGDNVATDAGDVPYDGRVSVMKDVFKNELKETITNLLESKKLIKKKLNGKLVTASLMWDFLKACFSLIIYNNPKAPSEARAMMDAEMNILASKCSEVYKEIVDPMKDTATVEEFREIHNLAKTKALVLFDETRKMGDAEDHEEYKVSLELFFNNIYLGWIKNALNIAKDNEEIRRLLQEQLTVNSYLKIGIGVALASIGGVLVYASSLGLVIATTASQPEVITGAMVFAKACIDWFSRAL